MTPLQKRIIELSFKHKLTHVSSCLNTVQILAEIYWMRNCHEPVVLGNGHAALALYVVLESIGMCDAEEMIHDHGVHASRDPARGIWVSGGSLGQAETVAVGLAMADLNRRVWLVTSDGSCQEGAVYEAMRIARKFCPNLQTYVIYNGWGAYASIDKADLPANAHVENVGANLPAWMQGLAGHYLTLTEQQCQECMR